MIKTIDITGNLMDDLYTLLNVYKLESQPEPVFDPVADWEERYQQQVRYYAAIWKEDYDDLGMVSWPPGWEKYGWNDGTYANGKPNGRTRYVEDHMKRWLAENPKPEVGTKSKAQTVRVNEGDLLSTAQTNESPTKWLADELKNRFPKNLTPNSKQLNEILAKCGNDRTLLDDLLLVAEEAATTQKINSLGGFLLYQLQQTDGDLSSIRANGERIRENRASDTTTVVANAMKEAGEKIKKLPARTGPNLAGANRLKNSKIGGAENLERSEGSATAP